jgi:hypothetical protein
MTRLELSPDGYERIMKKIQDIEGVLGNGFFEPDTAVRCLRTAYGELGELRRTLHEVCLLAPDAAEPPGPGAA